MSRLQEMKSKGLDKVKVQYSRSSFFGSDKTMQEVVDEIKNGAREPTREHGYKTKSKTLKANLKV